MEGLQRRGQKAREVPIVLRYTEDIVFVRKGSSHYDPDLGKYVEEEPIKTGTSANVTDLGTDRSVTLFGSIKQGAKVIRTMPLFSVPEWDYIEFGGKTYQLTTERTPDKQHTLIVEEVTVNG